MKCIAGLRGSFKCDITRAENIFRLSAKRTSPFKSAGGRQFSRLLAAEVCASAVVMLDTPCSEVVWRVLATHSIRQFTLHLPLPCVTVRHYISTGLYLSPMVLLHTAKWKVLGSRILCVCLGVWCAVCSVPLGTMMQPERACSYYTTLSTAHQVPVPRNKPRNQNDMAPYKSPSHRSSNQDFAVKFISKHKTRGHFANTFSPLASTSRNTLPFVKTVPASVGSLMSQLVTLRDVTTLVWILTFCQKSFHSLPVIFWNNVV